MQAVAAVLLSVSPTMLCQAAQPGKEIIGTWRFTKVLDLAEMTSIDEEGARQLLGHTMTISTNGTRFDDEFCQPPDFETKRVEPNLYLQREAGVDNSKLRLPNPVTVIDINALRYCRDRRTKMTNSHYSRLRQRRRLLHTCTQALTRNPDRLVIFWEGWYFEAARVGR